MRALIGLLSLIGLCLGVEFSVKFSAGGRYLESDSGIKYGIMSVTYTNLKGSKVSKTLKDYMAVFGYVGAKMNPYLSSGVSFEVGSASFVEPGNVLILTPFELSPTLNFKMSRNAYAFMGAGMSINRVKELVGNQSGGGTSIGLQGFLGILVKLHPIVGLSVEYKAKTSFGGSYKDLVANLFTLTLHIVSF